VKIPALVEIDADFWTGRRVLVTGHTGFKGGWLSLWLQSLGARVTGLAPGSPTSPSLYELAGVGEGMGEREIDVRDAHALAEAVSETRPEVVFHLAAQPLVRRSLREPALTYAINAIGTVNLLEAVRVEGTGVEVLVVVTSDKCYADPVPTGRPLVEGDPLGGADPYSSSKACAELIVSAYRRSFLSREGAPRVASARAGNVIGGGDWGEDRLIADSVRAVQDGRPLLIRSPEAVRPWQHVLNPLAGYLVLAQALHDGPAAARAWNFGPPAHDARTVGWIVERLERLWEGRLRWELDERQNPPEATHLTLDSGAAARELGWGPGWDLADALRLAVEWHEAHARGEDMREVSLAQIRAFGTGAGRWTSGTA
jgi:CDP-glucose 4,6-dehydratase